MQAPRQLSFREVQIVELVAQAKTNKEIGYELCLTEGTVKEYLYHIFRKLNVTNRTELALRSQRFDSLPAARTGWPAQGFVRSP
jgi:DNA-binding NarL/FixJ family response regulator